MTVESRNLRITARQAEYDWGLMPLRMRAVIAARVLLGWPFTVPGRMVFTVMNATDDRDAAPGSRASLDVEGGG